MVARVAGGWALPTEVRQLKAVAQLGVTLGRAFPYELFWAVSPVHEATFQHALARLVEAELLAHHYM